MPKVRRLPQRQCVGCGQVRSKRDMVRVVRTPEGDVRIDPSGKLSGRGAYVCPEPACADRALREGRLARMLEREISADVAGALAAAIARPAAPRAPTVRRIPLSLQEAPATSTREGDGKHVNRGGMS